MGSARKAVVVGAGRIGCGFAGQLLRQSGYDVVFIARRPELACHLNRLGRYEVCLTEGGSSRVVPVHGIRALTTDESEAIAREVAGADLLVTAVGSASLHTACRILSEGIRRRTTSVTVLAFENLGSGRSLRALADQCFSSPGTGLEHGLAPVLVSRIVSERLGDPAEDEPLVFVGDPSESFLVDGGALVNRLPPVDGMRVVDDFEAWLERKLFIFSAGHATAAYLGSIKGYRYIHSAVRDPEIRAAVLAVMREGREGLLAKHGPEIAGTERDLIEILARFENAALNDVIDRVGRDPMRKLSPEERLAGAARLARRAGVQPNKLMLAVAAALAYTNRTDPSAARLQQQITTDGAERVVEELSGFTSNSTMGRGILQAYGRLSRGRPDDSALLSLKRFFWA